MVLWTLALAHVVTAAVHRAELPQRVASHFDASGVPDGWMGRDAFLLLCVGVAVFVALLISGIGWLTPRLPNALINVPHKEYWLAPERRYATLRRMATMLAAIGIATLLLLLVVFHLTVRANRAEEVRLSGVTWIALAGYGTAVLAIVAAGVLPFFRRRRPARDAQDREPS